MLLFRCVCVCVCVCVCNILGENMETFPDVDNNRVTERQCNCIIILQIAVYLLQIPYETLRGLHHCK